MCQGLLDIIIIFDDVLRLKKTFFISFNKKEKAQNFMNWY